ncbi:hypothetical protein QS306_09710 [Paraburkholderia bonniea]|uniref:hypothetical protein n=1 Tax=Paraburkholderia bonniea TaxID=2152891 RepID=UPI00257335F5|nr:hypothetical protein [Paraburkholderia bonniea]WJF89394.1 hypothetical protein QS306_09710 [Paraburkholderia bonniea]WJF92709.1 hypothetical protein QS308_09720 [Paraburkholderia bonniea]
MYNVNQHKRKAPEDSSRNNSSTNYSSSSFRSIQVSTDNNRPRYETQTRNNSDVSVKIFATSVNAQSTRPKHIRLSDNNAQEPIPEWNFQRLDTAETLGQIAAAINSAYSRKNPVPTYPTIKISQGDANQLGFALERVIISSKIKASSFLEIKNLEHTILQIVAGLTCFYDPEKNLSAAFQQIDGLLKKHSNTFVPDFFLRLSQLLPQLHEHYQVALLLDRLTEALSSHSDDYFNSSELSFLGYSTRNMISQTQTENFLSALIPVIAKIKCSDSIILARILNGVRLMGITSNTSKLYSTLAPLLKNANDWNFQRISMAADSLRHASNTVESEQLRSAIARLLTSIDLPCTNRNEASSISRGISCILSSSRKSKATPAMIDIMNLCSNLIDKICKYNMRQEFKTDNFIESMSGLTETGDHPAAQRLRTKLMLVFNDRDHWGHNHTARVIKSLRHLPTPSIKRPSPPDVFSHENMDDLFNLASQKLRFGQLRHLETFKRFVEGFSRKEPSFYLNKLLTRLGELISILPESDASEDELKSLLKLSIQNMDTFLSNKFAKEHTLPGIEFIQALIKKINPKLLPKNISDICDPTWRLNLVGAISYNENDAKKDLTKNVYADVRFDNYSTAETNTAIALGKHADGIDIKIVNRAPIPNYSIMYGTEKSSQTHKDQMKNIITQCVNRLRHQFSIEFNDEDGVAQLTYLKT